MKKQLLLAIVAYLALSWSEHASAQQTAQTSPRVVVNLLDYLAKDYGGAVVGGKIISTSEYQEQQEFARSALSMANDVPELTRNTAVMSDLRKLNQLIESKGDAKEVAALALQIKGQVIAASGIAQAPKRWPDLKQGTILYQSNCATCHGENGAADGPAAAGLDPRPSNFLVDPVAQSISPFRAFNVIRLGIPNTAMVAWTNLTDDQTWDLAFFVTSLHIREGAPASEVSKDQLLLVASKTDIELSEALQGELQTKQAMIASLRLHSEDRTPDTPNDNTLGIAGKYLDDARSAYARNDYASAKQSALLAYLEGIEPVEPSLRGRDAAFVSELEERMAGARSTIESRKPLTDVDASIALAKQSIARANELLNQRVENPSVTFVLTFGILIREGFEAVLILIALLTVIRASNAPRASRWVHGGWIAAVGVGLLSWFFSGLLIAISGAQREMVEGVTGVLAVVTLLYIGFWLHSRTEITRWNHFIKEQVTTLLKGSSLWGLAALAFMAVFREAFETVLFLRAVSLEGGQEGTRAMALGVVVAFAILFGLSAALIKYSVKIPIRKIFMISSALMAVLTLILCGKSIHAFQEVGLVSISRTPWNASMDLLGIYPSWQAVGSQIVIACVLYALWSYGNRTPPRVAT